MKIRTIVLMILIALLGIFLIVNWTTLSTDVAVNLIYTEIQAPLGIVVVSAFSFLCFVLFIYMLMQQAGMVYEVSHANKMARQATTVAEDAEKSRVTEMRQEMNARFEKIEEIISKSKNEVLEELDEKQRNYQLENNERVTRSLAELKTSVAEVLQTQSANPKEQD